MSEPSDLRWWKLKGDERANAICAAVKRIKADQEYRRQDDLLHASLYGDTQVLGFGAYNYAKRPTNRGGQLSLNIVRNMISACVSRVAAKAKPKPSFQVKGGDWALRRRARKLEKAVDGIFYATGFYAIAKTCFRDALIFGPGTIEWGVDYEAKRVFCQRKLSGEVVVDDLEALYGGRDVKTYYSERYWDKAVLAEIYPQHTNAIWRAKAEDDDGGEAVGFDPTCDQVIVRTAFRLPAFKGSKVPGVWSKVIPGTELASGDYTRDRPPLATYRWDEGIAGWHGNGLAHELAGLQLEINDILDEIQDAQHGIKGKWFVEQSSQVNEEHIDDNADGIVMYRGTVPVYVSPQAIPADVYNHLWQLYAKAYEIAGISQLAASSQKPGGLNSGAALRAFRDSQSERFLDRFQDWDEFILENARLALDAMRDLAEATDGAVTVSVRRGTVIEELRWDELDIDEDAYELQMMPTSMLPTTVAGKLAFVEQMAQIGVVDPEELLELLELPDTERFTKRRLATRQLVEDMLEDMVETGVYQAPEPHMFFPTALKVAVESYLEYRRDKCPPELLDLVSRFIVHVRLLQKKQQAEDAPPPPPPPGPGPIGTGTPAAPMMPPTPMGV